MNSRRAFLRGSLFAATTAWAQPKPPNVLFIVVDDLRCRIGCFGDPIAKTPNIDGLAARGIRFDRAYCQFPLCNPTRSSVLSGRYPTSTRVFDNNTLLVLEGDQLAMPDYFARNGYATDGFGKVHHAFNRGMRKGEPKPTTPAAAANWFTPDERARQESESPAYWDTAHSPYRNMRVENPKQYDSANKIGPLPDNDRGLDAQIADQAVDSLGKLASGGKPFFLAVGFHKPHVPLNAPKQYFDMYDPARMPLPADFDSEPRAIEGVPPLEFRQNIDLYAARSFSSREAREAIRAYYACISYTDAQIGRVLAQLKESGMDDNTIVVMWGDHGWHLSEKGMWAKGTLFEVSARGPMIIVDPRKRTAGQASKRVVQYLDMYPTLADLCGLPRAPWLEGVSLKPLLENPKAEWDRPAYTVAVRNWSIGKSVRTERWRYTEWDEGKRGSALFDHDADPDEMANLAADPAHAGTVAAMRRLLREGPIARRA